MELFDYSADQSILAYLLKNIFEQNIVLGSEEDVIKRYIKQGTNNIDINGDFTIALKPFNKIIARSLDDDKSLQEFFDKLNLVSRVEICKENLKIFLNRKLMFATLMPLVCDDYWRSSTLAKYTIHILASDSEKDSLTTRRCNLISQHLKYILDANGTHVNLSIQSQSDSSSWISDRKERSDSQPIYYYKIAESFNKCQDSREKVIVCSAVVNKSSGSKSLISSEDYVKLLKDELRRASLHKGGITENESWESYINCLAVGCLNLQLMNVNHSSILKVDFNEESQNSREAAFILYNHARLCSLFKNFELLIQNGVIPSLPPMAEVNFTLLKHSEEWELFWLFILKYPEVLKEVATEAIHAYINSKGRPVAKVPTHAVTKFLHKLSHCLSVYYNRVHVLPSYQDTNRKISDHLLPVLWARIYLLKAVHLIMKSCLDSLNVIPPTVM